MTVLISSIANSPRRRSFIGGTDARVVMGGDEAALLRLWREKRGEAEPEDLSGNLLVELGRATEHLNRQWFERTTGEVVKDVQSWVRHPVLRWMAATLDGIVEGSGAGRKLVGLLSRDQILRTYRSRLDRLARGGLEDTQTGRL